MREECGASSKDGPIPRGRNNQVPGHVVLRESRLHGITVLSLKNVSAGKVRGQMSAQNST